MTDSPHIGKSEAANAAPKQDAPPDRRELIKRLGKAAVLPVLVATFVVSDATDAAAY